MALSKTCLVFLILAFLAVGHLANTANAIDCAAACQVRCSKSWKPKMCHRACGTCCARCSCVPPGTSVYTRADCPCYAKMTTHGGRLKCP